MNALKLSREQVGLLFPAFLETDADLRVVVIGPALQRLVKQDLVGESLTAFATFEQPLGDSDVDVLVLRQSSLKLRLASEDLLLRGVVLKLACGYLFCLSHAVERPQQLLQRGLRMEDFSPLTADCPWRWRWGSRMNCSRKPETWSQILPRRATPPSRGRGQRASFWPI